MNGRVRSIAEWGAAVSGVALATALFLSWAVPGGATASPASVMLVAERSQVLDVQPAGSPLGRSMLVPGSPAQTRIVTARNATGRALVVHLRAEPRDEGLDGALVFRIRAGSRTIFSGALGDLRRSGSKALTLPSHATARFDVRMWMRPGVRGYDARVLTLPLRFETEATA